MSTLTTSRSTAAATASPLRRLYLSRAVFAFAWAGLFAATGSDLGALTAVLLVLYPLVDAASAFLDTQTTHDGRTRLVTALNVATSLVAAIALAVAAAGDVADVLVVWGVWAVVSGLVQLVGAVRRRALGGQRFLVASGALSVLAGASFVVSAADATTMTNLAGYAALGGIFFLVSALRLGRADRARRSDEV